MELGTELNQKQGVPMRAGNLTFGLFDWTPETRFYWEKLEEEGRVYVKKCQECGAFNHPRKVVCADCEGMEFTWTPVSGRGKVYTFSTLHHAAAEDAVRELPYTLGIVMLEEGVPLFGKIEKKLGGPISINDEVEVTVRELFGRRLPVFVG